MAKEKENREMCHNVSGILLKHPFWFLLLAFEDVNTYRETVQYKFSVFSVRKITSFVLCSQWVFKILFLPIWRQNGSW